MLILSLKAGETVHIGVDVVITNTSDRHISLGFEAPDATRILRGALALRSSRDDNSGMPTESTPVQPPNG